MKRYTLPALGLLVATLLASSAGATMPPRIGSEAADNPVVLQSHPSPVKRGLKSVVRRIWKARDASPASALSSPDPILRSRFRVSGTVEIPVLLVTFANTPQAPFAAADYQRQLFDGPWPTGTLTDYYREVSYGAFELRGQVLDWRQLPSPDEFYEGADYRYRGRTYPCLGRCDNAQIPRLVEDAVALHASTVDWGRYDNDGPDGQPNSGDDDGFVDFVAIVHAEAGSECGANKNVWSHQFSLSGSEHEPIRTGARAPDGREVLIDDYALIAGLDCTSARPNPIGIIAHEFAHAFGLPDLYDTNAAENGHTAGVGRWCLMGYGGWTADGERSSDRPVHLSPWAKAALGWLDFRDVRADTSSLELPGIEHQRVGYRLRITEDVYYVLVNVRRDSFNAELPGAGLQIWHINEPLIAATILSNKVNTGPRRKGVDLVEADGLERLDSQETSYAGGLEDLFPGPQNARRFDETTLPRTWGNLAVCNISDPAPTMTVQILKSRARCDTSSSGPSVLGPPPP